MKNTLIDGGLGQELVARSGIATPLWSVQALLDDPDLVGQVHADYFAAGAEVATTNTYSVLPDRLQAQGIEHRLEELITIACNQAESAREANGSGQIAGSMGPIGFSYQPDKCPSAQEAAEIYHRVCKAQSKHVDFFIAETMASVEQVRGALMGMAGFGKPIWIAATVDDTDGSRLRSGEPLIELLPLLKEYSADAILINCSVPEAVSQGIPYLDNDFIPVGAYANGFTGISKEFDAIGATVDMLESRTDLGPSAYAEFVDQWIKDGASIVGGCCEVGPAHISELKQRFF